MDLDISGHALTVVEERELDKQWVLRTVEAAELVEAHDDGTKHYLLRIPERDDRVLRVVVNPMTVPPKVVTVFFDRR